MHTPQAGHAACTATRVSRQCGAVAPRPKPSPDTANLSSCALRTRCVPHAVGVNPFPLCRPITLFQSQPSETDSPHKHPTLYSGARRPVLATPPPLPARPPAGSHGLGASADTAHPARPQPPPPCIKPARPQPGKAFTSGRLKLYLRRWPGHSRPMVAILTACRSQNLPSTLPLAQNLRNPCHARAHCSALDAPPSCSWPSTVSGSGGSGTADGRVVAPAIAGSAGAEGPGARRGLRISLPHSDIGRCGGIGSPFGTSLARTHRITPNSSSMAVCTMSPSSFLGRPLGRL